MAPKRAFVDLTGDDFPPTYQNARPRLDLGTPQNPFCIDDDEDGNQEVAALQNGYLAEPMPWCYGSRHIKIVGVRYSHGIAIPGQMVKLQREPKNTHDRNAIRVLNLYNVPIGHIPKSIAARLAKYMDGNLVTVEGIISGPRTATDYPMELKLYGPDHPALADRLIVQLRVDSLPYEQAMSMRKRQQQQQAQQQQLQQQEEQYARARLMHGRFGLNSQFGTGTGGVAFSVPGSSQYHPYNIDAILERSQRVAPRNSDQLIEEYGIKQEDLATMPKAPQPHALAIELRPFQLQGLQWLLDQESPQLPGPGSKEIVQLWRRQNDVPNMFTNVATHSTHENPSLSSGGILADDMGLGKTVQMISLIMADRALGRRNDQYSNATLIIAPVSVMSNWSSQIARHIKPEHKLNVLIYHGNRKKPLNPKEISKYDVVISTYESVSVEWHALEEPEKAMRDTGIFSIKWRRIVLDEGHQIRNPKSKKTIAIGRVNAQSRWILTGTPIINTLKDLYSLVCFLQPLGILKDYSVFHQAIIRPCNNGQGAHLQLLMTGICLRRKKDMPFVDLRIPDLSEYVHTLKFLPHEKQKYDALELEGKNVFAKLEDQMNEGQGNEALKTRRHLLEVLLRMRQLCNHWKLLSNERLESVLAALDAQGSLELTQENTAALQEMLQLFLDSEEDCPVCIDHRKDSVITKCGHIFCTPCIQRVIVEQHKCPMCRIELESMESSIVKPAEAQDFFNTFGEQISGETADKESLETEASSKITALMSILRASAQDPTNKTVIFSQWTSFLNLLEPHLTANNFKFTRIDGRMTAPKRDEALAVFDHDPGTTILLASLAVASVGLNLVVANQVILSDSWWAPAIEDQAVDRVHRLGQTRETKVWRLVLENSVEERVLGIQEKKRELASMAFGERKKERRGPRRGMQDLMTLLGLGSGNRGATAASSSNANRQGGNHGASTGSSSNANRERSTEPRTNGNRLGGSGSQDAAGASNRENRESRQHWSVVLE